MTLSNKDIRNTNAVWDFQHGIDPKLPPEPKKLKKTHVSESVAQQRIFRWADEQWQWKPDIDMMYHIPNEGAGGNPYRMQRLIQEGLKPGMPDIHLPVPRCGYHGLWIELKVGYNKPTPQQLHCLAELRRLGHYATWCRGEEAAIELITKYMSGDLDERRVD